MEINRKKITILFIVLFFVVGPRMTIGIGIVAAIGYAVYRLIKEKEKQTEYLRQIAEHLPNKKPEDNPTFSKGENNE